MFISRYYFIHFCNFHCDFLCVCVCDFLFNLELFGYKFLSFKTGGNLNV